MPELELLEEGLEPSRGLHLFGFSYYFSFRCPFRVRSLDFPLAMTRPPQAPAAKSLHLPARTASSRFHTRNRLGRSRSSACEQVWLGIATTIAC